MATVQQLIEQIEYLVDDEVTTPKAIMLINMALDDLSEVAGYLKIVEADFPKGLSNVSIPSDYIQMEEVRVKRSTDGEFKQVLLDAFFHKYEEVVQDEDFFMFGEARKDMIHRYRLTDDVLTFLPAAPYDGSIQLKYYAMLPHISADNLNEIPKLRPTYHKAIPLYAAAKYHQNWKDSLGEKNDFWQEYMVAKAALHQETQDRKKKSKSQYIIKVRSWK